MVSAKIQPTEPTHEKALRVHSAEDAPQEMPALRSPIQTRLGRSENLSNLFTRSAPLQVRVRPSDSPDPEVRMGTQPKIRESVEEGDEVLRMWLWSSHSSLRPPTFSDKTIRKWPQRAQSRTRSLAGTARPILCLRVRKAGQAKRAPVEARRVSLYFGPQSRRARRSPPRVEGRLFAAPAACGEPQSLPSLAPSGPEKGSLYVPEMRVQEKFGSCPPRGLFRNRRASRRQPAGDPRLSYPGDGYNSLPELSPRKTQVLTTPLNYVPADSCPPTAQMSEGPDFENLGRLVGPALRQDVRSGLCGEGRGADAGIQGFRI